jgi:hydrogenase expression/formation protein HypC
MCLGIPGQIVEIVDATFQFAKVDVSGVKRGVNIALLAEEGIAPGDWVLINAGLALRRLEADEASQVLQLIKELERHFEEEQT